MVVLFDGFVGIYEWDFPSSCKEGFKSSLWNVNVDKKKITKPDKSVLKAQYESLCFLLQ